MTKRSPTVLSLSWICLSLLAACGPGVSGFTATPDHVAYGSKATLTWHASNAASVSISGVGDLPATQTTVDVWPTQTTTYVLTARDGSGHTATSSVTVTLPATLAMTGGTYNDNPLGLTLAAVLRDGSGAPPANDTQVTLNPPSPGSPFTVTCPGGKPLCLVELPGTPPASGAYVANASVGGTALSASFSVNPALLLPPAAPIAIQQVDAQTLKASWAPVESRQGSAVSFHVYPVDLSSPTQPIGPDQIVSGTSVMLATSQPMNPSHQYGLHVESSLLDLSGATAPATLPVPNVSIALGQRVGGPLDGWQYVDPSRWDGDVVTVSVDALGPSEQLAVLVLNAGGQDNAPATITVSGTGTQVPLPPPPQALMAAIPDGADGPRALHAPPGAHERERAEEAAVVAPLQQLRGSTALPQPLFAPASGLAPTNTSFCVRQGTGNIFVRKTATLQRETAHALFYVDDQDASTYAAQAPTLWDSLQANWEGKAYPGDTSTFGAESDVDNNGKLIIFFTRELGAAQNGAILLGYYTPLDVAYALDSTPSCTGTGSNQADMFYMNSLQNILNAYNSNPSNGTVPASYVYTETYPNTLAHEFQHLINFNQHCLVRNCSVLEDTWINEGLSMVAQEIGGFGWNGSEGRYEGALYMDRLVPTASDPIRSYNGRGLTKWEADPIGNYEGAHSFMRYWADRLGPQVLGAMVQTNKVGVDNLNNALGGKVFGRAFAEWATSVVFSNETLDPVQGQFDFTGNNWTPLHSQLRHLNYVPLGSGTLQTLTLRQDGWNAFVTGYGTGAKASVSLLSYEQVKPTVVVVRFSGALPQK